MRFHFKNARILAATFFSALIFLQSPCATALEKVGEFKIETITLRPTWVSDEQTGADFVLSDSVAAFSWSKDKKLSVLAGVGSTLERNLPVYYTATNEDELGFYEMYAQYQGVYGKTRFGLIPLNFGYDGVIESSHRYFERALPYKQRAFGLRDYGFSFYTENKGYFTEIIAHNGEVDTTSDGRLWTTARWGFDKGKDFRAQVSLQTGYVKDEVSLGNTENVLGGVTNGETAKWRNGLIFLNWYPRRWNVVFQYGGGEFVQGDREGQFSTQTLTVTRLFNNQYGAGFRYDEFDPNSDLSNDKITEYSLLLLAKSIDSTSTVYLAGTKVEEQGTEVANDQLRLVWLLTPYVH